MDCPSHPKALKQADSSSIRKVATLTATSFCDRGFVLGDRETNRKRPEFPSGRLPGMSLTMSSWCSQRLRWRNVGFAGFGRWRRSAGLLS